MSDPFTVPRAKGELYNLFKQQMRLLGEDGGIDAFLYRYGGLETVNEVNQQIRQIRIQIHALEQSIREGRRAAPSVSSLPSTRSSGMSYVTGGSLSRIGGELSDVHINQLVRKYKLNNFGGCISKDQLAEKGQIGRRMIINMQNHTGGGTHWVYLDTTDPKRFYYCDSFGVVPPVEVETFARKLGARLFYNKVDMQSYYSDACGWYCLYMMAQMQRGRKMRDIVDRDFVNLRTMRPRRNNDQVLQKFFS